MSSVDDRSRSTESGSESSQAIGYGENDFGGDNSSESDASDHSDSSENNDGEDAADGLDLDEDYDPNKLLAVKVQKDFEKYCTDEHDTSASKVDPLLRACKDHMLINANTVAIPVYVENEETKHGCVVRAFLLKLMNPETDAFFAFGVVAVDRIIESDNFYHFGLYFDEACLKRWFENPHVEGTWIYGNWDNWNNPSTFTSYWSLSSEETDMLFIQLYDSVFGGKPIDGSSSTAVEPKLQQKNEVSSAGDTGLQQENVPSADEAELQLENEPQQHKQDTTASGKIKKEKTKKGTNGKNSKKRRT